MKNRTAWVVLGIVLLATPGWAQELGIPSDWRWVLDEPAQLVTGEDLPDSAWRFVAMPPGWHVTTGPGVLLYEPGYKGRGRYALEAEVFLFPGESEAVYGLFLGGSGLEEADPGYTAFLARRDGSAAILNRRAGAVRLLLPWTQNPAITTHSGEETAKNVLRVEVGSEDVVFQVNGEEVGRVRRSETETRGVFGFRIEAGVNLHASRLDLTYHLAPPRRMER